MPAQALQVALRLGCEMHGGLSRVVAGRRCVRMGISFSRWTWEAAQVPLLKDMPLERANQVLRHPIHQEGIGTLVRLITALRQCRAAEDYHQFQQDLLTRVLAVQEHRARCRRVESLLRQGKAVPVDAPELRSADPPANPETWELEADVCERVDRQLRSVADALAWRVFNYDRRVIIALSRNQHPGPMAGKKGLAAERAFVIDWWREERRFVLLHDLTSCLSIGDATSFKCVFPSLSG